jgi:hypothetical protein
MTWPVSCAGSDEWTSRACRRLRGWEIPIGNGQVHVRRVGAVLHPERNQEDLESLRARLPPEIYAAQYQQRPVAPGGHDQARLGPAMINRSGRSFSVGCSQQARRENDYSVCHRQLTTEILPDVTARPV